MLKAHLHALRSDQVWKDYIQIVKNRLLDLGENVNAAGNMDSTAGCDSSKGDAVASLAQQQPASIDVASVLEAFENTGQPPAHFNHSIIFKARWFNHQFLPELLGYKNPKSKVLIKEDVRNRFITVQRESQLKWSPFYF